MLAACLGKGQFPDRHYFIDSSPDHHPPPTPPPAPLSSIGVTTAIRRGGQEGFSSMVQKAAAGDRSP